MRALRDFNLPKIVADDMVVFTGLLRDLFPDVYDTMPRARDAAFEVDAHPLKLALSLSPSP
eukprot:3671935-Pleurochrysis_carterae.AAC.3